MEIRELSIQVVSTDGLPIQGAAILPVGMRSKEEPGSGYGWRPDRVPGVNGGTSNASGWATISYPAHPMDNLTTGTVIVMIEHPEMCSAHVEVNVDAPRPITLARGTGARFSAQALPGVLFSELYADIEHSDRQTGRLKWEREPDGLSLSSHLPKGNYIARLIGFGQDGKTYFGEPRLFVVPPPEGSALDLAWELREGSPVRGTLGLEAPRPIRNGWAVAAVTSPQLVKNACGLLSNRWEASVDVAADGTFVFSNLPEGTLEIIAGCEGYVSADAHDHPYGAVRDAQVMPDDRSLPVTLPMEATGDARIFVLAPDGQPLRDAYVHFCPNQSLGRHTSIIGTKFDTAKRLRRQSEANLEARSREVPPFSEKTDADGMALIRGLPAGRERFFVVAPELEQPILEEQSPMRPGEYLTPRREGKIAIYPGEESTARVQMEPKGTTSLSAAINAAHRSRRRSPGRRPE